MRGLSRFLIVLMYLVGGVASIGVTQLKEPHQGKLGDACEDCHTLEGWTPSTFTVERHQSTEFPLKAKHAQVECAECHTDQLFKGTPTDCFSCHQTTDVQQGHRGQLGQDCASCHSETGWPEHLFSVERHQQTDFRLEGKHRQADCASCHVERQYLIEDRSCLACHSADESRTHRGELGTECTDCHTVEGWKPSTYDHAERWIEKVRRSRIRRWFAWLLPEALTPKDQVFKYQYRLTGQHVNVRCEQCHVDSQHRGTGTDCFSCHQQDDPHTARLGEDCARCHSPEGWEQLHFEHEQAGFTLAGRHAEIPCIDCHADEKYRELPTGCQQCHAGDTSHAQDTVSECELCHTPSDWRIISFEHAALRFGLEGRHAQAECSDCHFSESFRGLEGDCIRCHQDPHGGDFGNQCDVCHTPLSWETSVFDHDATRFPLTGRHQGLDCENCHQLSGYKGLQADCRSCHQADSPPNHFGPMCADCHSTTAWIPASFLNFHHDAFPIDRGEHLGLSCNRCHVIAEDFRSFSCISGGCHPRAETNDEHQDEIRGYVYESPACYQCHPNGRKDDSD